jgi:polysaccharide deacetylase
MESSERIGQLHYLDPYIDLQSSPLHQSFIDSNPEKRMIIVCLLLCLLLLLSFLVYASYSIQSGIYLRSFCKKHTAEKIVALTFDDGPDSLQTPKVLQVLKEYQVTACFFCIGHKVKGNEAILQKMVAEGHLIGNHSHTHSGLFPLYGLSKMKKDLQTCQCELERVTSQPVSLFRPPFGVTNPTIAKAVRQLGYTPIGWSIRTLDTQQAPDKVLARIRKCLEPGAIILLHDRMPDSDQLVKQILDLLKEQGYTVVRPDKLLA